MEIKREGILVRDSWKNPMKKNKTEIDPNPII